MQLEIKDNPSPDFPIVYLSLQVHFNYFRPISGIVSAQDKISHSNLDLLFTLS